MFREIKLKPKTGDIMTDEYRDEANMYNEEAREAALNDGEIDSAEEGFLKGYEADADGSEDSDDDDDEAITG